MLWRPLRAPQEKNDMLHCCRFQLIPVLFISCFALSYMVTYISSTWSYVSHGTESWGEVRSFGCHHLAQYLRSDCRLLLVPASSLSSKPPPIGQAAATTNTPDVLGSEIFPNITSSLIFNYFSFVWDICFKVYINILLWLIFMLWFGFCWWICPQLTDSSLPEVRSGWGCHTPWTGGCCPQWTPGRPPLGHWPDQYRSR